MGRPESQFSDGGDGPEGHVARIRTARGVEARARRRLLGAVRREQRPLHDVRQAARGGRARGQRRDRCDACGSTPQPCLLRATRPRWGTDRTRRRSSSATALFTTGVAGRLQCLDKATGKLLWTEQLWETHQGSRLMYGYASSPIAFRDTVIVPVGARDKGDHGVPAGRRKGRVGQDESTATSTRRRFWSASMAWSSWCR